MTDEFFKLRSLVSNSAEICHVAGLNKGNLKRDVTLRVRPGTNGQGFWMVGIGDEVFPGEEGWDVDIPPARDGQFGLFEIVEACRSEWRDKLVQYTELFLKPMGGQAATFVFQEEWDFAKREDAWLSRIGARLAVAGNKLFYRLFEDTADPKRLALAERLKSASRERPLVITVTSNEFIVPWGMLYVHPGTDELASDGVNFDWEGFWGCRHVIEHNTEAIRLETALARNDEGKIPTGVHVDERIDTVLNLKCIQEQLEFFALLPQLDLCERRTKDQVEIALSSIEFTDRIMYFCCHGRGSTDGTVAGISSPCLTLSDDLPITTGDLNYWLRKHGDKQAGLSTNPVVFINSCQSAQGMTLFFMSLVVEFLSQQAVGVIGAQVDIPVVFASEYAKRFFKRFVHSGTRIGPLMRELAREFLRDHKNPLGLVYSLYRGIDCRIEA